MSTDGNTDRPGSKTFRSSYLNSTDIGKMPSFSLHLNQQPVDQCRFTDSEFSRRANYWGKGVPDRHDLFWNGTNKHHVRDRKYGQSVSAMNSSSRTFEWDGMMNKNTYHSRYLGGNSSYVDGGGDGKTRGCILGGRVKHVLGEYTNKPPPRSVAPSTVSSSQAFSKRWREQATKSKPPWNSRAAGVKMTTAKDFWQEDTTSTPLNKSSFMAFRRATGCRSRSFSPKVNRGRRRRTRSGSKSQSPHNRSHNNAKRCWCVWCITPRSKSCPKPRTLSKSRSRSPNKRGGPCLPKCDNKGGIQSREAVVCFNSKSWAQSQIAVLKTFLKTTTCPEVVKLLALVRTLIRERYTNTNSCPKPCKNAIEVCQCPCNCQSNNGPAETPPCEQFSNPIPSPSTRMNCKRDEPPKRCRNRARSPAISKSRRPSKNRSCKRSPNRKQRCNFRCEEKCPTSAAKTYNVVIPNANDYYPDDDKKQYQKPNENPLFKGYKSESQPEKECSKPNTTYTFDNDKKSETKPSPQKPVQSWTNVIKDCKKFLKCSRDKRCKGRRQLAYQMVDMGYADTQNNNGPERSNSVSSVSDVRLTEDNVETDEYSSDEAHTEEGDSNCSHQKAVVGSYCNDDTCESGRPPVSQSYTKLSSSNAPPVDNRYKKPETSRYPATNTKSHESKSKHRNRKKIGNEKGEDSPTNNRVEVGNKATGADRNEQSDDGNIDPKALLNINKNTQKLLDKASERIKRVETYFDNNKDSDNPETTDAFQNQRNQTDHDYYSMLTESETAFLSKNREKSYPKEDNNKRHDFSKELNAPRNLTHNASQSQSHPLLEPLPGDHRHSKHSLNVRGSNERNSRVSVGRGRPPRSSYLRKALDEDDYHSNDVSTSSCVSMTSLDTNVSTKRGQRPRQQHVLIGNRNKKKDVKMLKSLLKPIALSYVDDVKGKSGCSNINIMTTCEPNNAHSSLDDSFLNLPSKLSTAHTCPVMVKRYDSSSPLPKQMQSFC